MLNFLFRKPKFPLICDIEGYVFAAKSDKSFVNCLSEVSLDPEKTYNVLDATGEGWVFSPQLMFISPLTFKKSWTKKEIILAYNGRKNASPDAVSYSEKSLSAKRFERVFGDIVELLLKQASSKTKTV